MAGKHRQAGGRLRAAGANAGDHGGLFPAAGARRGPAGAGGHARPRDGAPEAPRLRSVLHSGYDLHSRFGPPAPLMPSQEQRSAVCYMMINHVNLGNELCERLAYYSVATNLVQYMIDKLGYGNAAASNMVRSRLLPNLDSALHGLLSLSSTLHTLLWVQARLTAQCGTGQRLERRCVHSALGGRLHGRLLFGPVPDHYLILVSVHYCERFP